MTLYHPRVLADKLEALVPELQRWSHRASMALDNARVQQKRVEDRLLQTSHSAQVQEHQLTVDQKCLQQDEALLQTYARSCQEALANAQQTAGVTQSILHETQTTYDRVQQALQSAQEALTRAEQALQQASADVEGKEAEFANARGGADDKRAADGSLSAAKEARRQAHRAVRAVSTHVANCEKAFALANQALQLAEVAHQHAQANLKASEDSMEFVRAASRALDVGKQELSKEETTVKATLNALQRATFITQEASNRLSAARSHEQLAQLHTSDTLRILQVKIDLLIIINQSEVDVSSDPMVASLSADAVMTRGEPLQILNLRLERLQILLNRISGLKPKQWSKLNLEQRAEVLRRAHNAIAVIYGFASVRIEVTLLSKNTLGAFSEIKNKITINMMVVASNDCIEMLRTLVHESRHAYQWHVVQCFRRGPLFLSGVSRAQAREWSENFDDYKYPELYGTREYRNQPLEVDARSFAETVVKLFGELGK